MASGRDNAIVDDLDAQIAAAHALTEYEDRIEPRAVRAWYDFDRGVVMCELKNGCIFGFPPPKDPYWELADATPEQLAKVEVGFGGRVLLWDEIDAGIVVPGLLLHLLNVKAWYAKWLGGAKSEAKAAAARENGKKGGRPRKKPAAPKRASRRKTAQAGD
jgi:hypothetical protein